jgi:hypothetical protein
MLLALHECQKTLIVSEQLKEESMSSRIATLFLLGTLVGAASARAQEREPGPGTVEVTYIPAGAAFFTSKGNSPSFGNYGFGTGATVRINRYLGVEGELAAMIATTSDLQFGDLDTNIKSPNVLSYTANLIVSPWAGHSFAPYVAGGAGGLTMFERPQLGITSDETFFAGNVAAGSSGTRRTTAGAFAATTGSS